MARYDRLRVEGAGPLEAMREAASLFALEPHARPGQPAHRGRRSRPARPVPAPGRPAEAADASAAQRPVPAGPDQAA